MVGSWSDERPPVPGPDATGAKRAALVESLNLWLAARGWASYEEWLHRGCDEDPCDGGEGCVVDG